MTLVSRALLLVATLATTGCFQSSTLLRINADGSGTIEQTTILTNQAVRQLRQFEAMAGDASQKPELFSTSQARQMAAAIGPDVTLVSSTPIKTADGEGSKAIFAFPDINRLQIKRDSTSAASGGTDGELLDVSGQVRFALTRQADGRAILRINNSMPKLPTIPSAPGSSDALALSQISREQMQMIKQMFAGTRVSVAVEPAGQLVKTSSPFVDGQRVTLVEIAFDDLVANDAGLARVQAARTFDDVRAALKTIPGLKINLDPEITIEFVGR